MRDCDQQYKIAYDEEKLCSDTTQDILHYFELEPYNRSSFAKMAHKQKEIRERRRKAKEIMEQITPIKQWTDKQQQQIKEIEQVLGALRKAEKDAHRYRVYVPKTKEVLDAQINTGYKQPMNKYGAEE